MENLTHSENYALILAISDKINNLKEERASLINKGFLATSKEVSYISVMLFNLSVAKIKLNLI